MEWTIRLEARTASGDVTSYEVGALRRGMGDLTTDGTDLTLAKPKHFCPSCSNKSCGARSTNTSPMRGSAPTAQCCVGYAIDAPAGSRRCSAP